MTSRFRCLRRRGKISSIVLLNPCAARSRPPSICITPPLRCSAAWYSAWRKAQIVELATRATRLIRQLCERNPDTRWQYEYSPETFCFTEPEFALEICEAVAEIWQPCDERPMVINLPATVEVSTPNVYADQIRVFLSPLQPPPRCLHQRASA